MNNQLKIGTILEGFCEGYFGESYDDKIVIAIGDDWVVVRENGLPEIAVLEDPSYLTKFTKKYLSETQILAIRKHLNDEQ